jgi:iron complex outermembrane recepter protein
MWADSLITGPSRGDNRVNSKKTLSFAIAAVLTASGAGMANAQAPAAEPSLGLEEIVVTAQRRSENLQNVPISIQALTGETLKELKVSTLDEFVKYLPSVSTATLGPGQGNIYMRGLSVGALGTQGQGSVGQWPNVAVYLDEQSTQIPGRNLDVYAADLERIEVLEGPQGTLFGAGAQAGVLRYITAKPKYGVTEASASAGYDTTAHGADSSKLEAMLNLPLGDNLAARIVIYNDSRGGYIDNVASTFTRRSTDLGFAQRTGGVVPADSVVINNYNIAAKDINPVTYKGMRLGLNYKINDDWNVLFQQTYQDMNASGVFYQMPNGSEGQHLNPLEVTLFNNGNTTDKFSNSALTVNGKVGVLDLTYAGAYLSRNSFQIQDYTNYARGVYGSYYQCTGYSGASVNKCYTPSSVWRDTTHNTNQSHEIRLATPTSWTISGIGGVFWEQRKLNDDTEWQYKSVPECPDGNKGGTDCFLYLDPSQSPKFSNASLNDRGRRNANTGFFDDFQRTYTQRAIFGSADWHIVDNLTLTVGTRYYHIENQMLGGNMGSFFCKSYGAALSGACNGANSFYPESTGKAPYGTNLNNQDPHSATSSGFKSRVNLSWKPTADTLLYATWSQGYRPGGFNRGEAEHLLAAKADGTGPDTVLVNGKKKTYNQWHVPAEYESDTLTNIEAGWKTSFMHNRIQWNGAIYQEDWKNVQTGIFAPQLGLGNLTVGLNGPDYRVRGIEMSLIARATEGLTVQGSMSYNKSELITSPGLVGNVALRPDGSANPSYGQILTNTWVGGSAASGGHVAAVTNVFGIPGDPLANSPKVQANARARYEWSVNEYNYYWQLGAAYQSSSLSSATHVNQYEMPSWTTWDGSAGVSKGPWSAEVVGSNLTDINKSVFTSAAQFIRVEVPQRPRTLGLRIGYKFKG